VFLCTEYHCTMKVRQEISYFRFIVVLAGLIRLTCISWMPLPCFRGITGSESCPVVHLAIGSLKLLSCRPSGEELLYRFTHVLFPKSFLLNSSRWSRRACNYAITYIGRLSGGLGPHEVCHSGRLSLCIPGNSYRLTLEIFHCNSSTWQMQGLCSWGWMFGRSLVLVSSILGYKYVWSIIWTILCF
jgi:hypothetical protein